MKLKLHKNYPGDKDLLITDEDNPCGLSIRIDYDDVDHDTVLKETKELIRRVNSFNLK